MEKGVSDFVTVSFSPVGDVVKLANIRIPDFQRPYSWTESSVREFWDDLVDGRRKDPYFIGPIVTYTDPAGGVGVVDGQQRLTTLFLLASVIRDQAALLNDRKSLERSHGILVSSNDLPRLDAFQAGAALRAIFIGGDPLNRKLRLRGRGAKRIREAHVALGDLLAADLAQLSSTSQRKARLGHLIDLVLDLRVVWSQLQEPLRAFTFFETLNSKGTDLETVDLVKNLLFERRELGGGDSVIIRDAWAGFTGVLASRSVAPKTMLYHWWLSNHGYVTKRMMYSKIRAAYQGLNSGEALGSVNELEKAARAYIRVARPKTTDWDPNKHEIPELLALVASYGVVQPRPFLLQLVAGSEPELAPTPGAFVSTPRLREAVRAIEAFHLVYNAVSRRTSLPVVSEAYADRAVELGRVASTAAATAAIRGLISDLAQEGLRPTREVFVATLIDGPKYVNRKGANGTVRRVLTLWNASRGNSSQGRTGLTIEHWMPRTESLPWTNAIGNLALVPELCNEVLDDKTPAEKFALLSSGKADAGGMYVADLLAEWDREAAEARGRVIANSIYDHLESVLRIGK